MKEIKLREETPKLKIKSKPRDTVLPKAELVLSNADVKNFGKVSRCLQDQPRHGVCRETY